MPINAQFIPWPVMDPGSAQSLQDQQYQLDQVTSEYGVFGGGMTITGATIETANPGVSRVYMTQDSDSPGLFITDSTDTVQVEIGGGLGLYPGLVAYHGGQQVLALLGGGGAGLYLSTAPGSGQYSPVLKPGSGLGFLMGPYGSAWTSIFWGANAADNSTTVTNLQAGIDNAGYPQAAWNNQWFGNLQQLTLTEDGNGGSVGARVGNYSATLLNASGTMIVPSLVVNSTLVVPEIFSNTQWFGSITVAGPVTATAFITSSDEEFKSEIEDLSGANILYDLRPVSFHHELLDKQQMGFIAQEVRNVEPALAVLVSTKDEEKNERSYWGVDMGAILTLCVVEIQHLNERIKKLEESNA